MVLARARANKGDERVHLFMLVFLIVDNLSRAVRQCYDAGFAYIDQIELIRIILYFYYVAKCTDMQYICTILYAYMHNYKVNVKYSLARSPQGRIESGQLSNTCSDATEVTQWATPSYSRPQPATDNGVRAGRSN